MPLWYYTRDNQRHGPVSSQALKQLARQGQLLPDDLIWREGQKDWRPARNAKGLFAETIAPAESAEPPPLPSRLRVPGSVPASVGPGDLASFEGENGATITDAIGTQIVAPVARFADLEAQPSLPQPVPHGDSGVAATAMNSVRRWFLGLGLVSIPWLFLSWLDVQAGTVRQSVNVFSSTMVAFVLAIAPGVAVAVSLRGNWLKPPTRLGLTAAVAAFVFQGPEVLLLCSDFRVAALAALQQELISQGFDPAEVAEHVHVTLGMGLWLYAVTGVAGVLFCVVLLCQSRSAHLATFHSPFDQIAAWLVLLGTLALGSLLVLPSILGGLAAGLTFLLYGAHQMYAPQAWCLQSGRTSTSLMLNVWGVFFYFVGLTLTLESLASLFV